MARKFDIEIHDSNGDWIGIVRGVTAEDETEACKKVAEKKGYIWIGQMRDHPYSVRYAIDEAVYGWHNDKLEPEEYQGKLTADIESVRSGRAFEFHGLLELFETDTKIEDFEE